jgi:glycosyltransferase involved in cell wall biosynthesis
MLRLSICLPTYNRAHDCDRTAHTILREINGRWEQIEFIIADNASTDGTRDMVEALPERALIQYVRHGTNSGLVGNYCHCLRAARGEYVWVVGDDDEYHPGVVDKILDVIQTRAPGLIHLNFDFKDGRTGLLAARSYYGWQIVGAVPDSRRTMESMVTIDDGGLIHERDENSAGREANQPPEFYCDAGHAAGSHRLLRPGGGILFCPRAAGDGAVQRCVVGAP